MEFADFLASPLRNRTLCSDEPDVCKAEECCLGIDEAGRGPVLGPMVYGCSYCPINWIDELKSLKVADSKTLTEEQRETIFGRINKASDSIGWIIEILSPNYLSNGMLQKSKYNLNAISHDSAIGLIQKALDKGIRVTQVYVDTVGDAGKYQAKLTARFPNLSIKVTPKADDLFPIVGAASICAKVARDGIVRQWQFIEKGIEFSRDFGSGYPSDPQTKSWLQDNIDSVFGFPTFVRFSWNTCQVILQNKSVNIEWEDDTEEDDLPKAKRSKQASKGSAKLNMFFQEKEESHDALLPHKFFKERGLSVATKL